MNGIEVKVEGSWTWVYGNTYGTKESLKAQGLRWSPRRRAWYTKEIKDIQIKGTKEKVKEPNGRIQTNVEEAIKVKDGVYKGIATGSLYDGNGTILTKSTKLLTTADTKKPKSQKEVIAEGRIKNLSKREYGRIAHLYKYGEKSYMIEIEEDGNWGTATKRKLYKTEKGARKVFDTFNVEPLESKEIREAEIRIDAIRKQREEIEGYEKNLKACKEEYGTLIPI